MSLANGRHYLAIPGPSVMPDRVLQAMHRPAPNIYTGQLVDMVAGLVPDLKAVARTERTCGHVHRQRPRRVGGIALSTRSAAATGS
jgi:aspartate aminotransferase-like enzyme